MLHKDKRPNDNDPILLKCVYKSSCLLAFDPLFWRMLYLNDVGETSLIMICALYVHREQQESLAHADREDQRLVLLSRPLLVYRWRSWHLSEHEGSAWVCFRGTHTIQPWSIFKSQIPLKTFSVILITSTFFSRALEEREDREDQQEKLDQRCVKYWTTTVLRILLYTFKLLLLILSLQGNSGNDGPPGPPGERVCTVVIQGHVIRFTCIRFHRGQLIIYQQSFVFCFRVFQALRDQQVSQDQRALLWVQAPTLHKTLYTNPSCLFLCHSA